MRVKLQQRQFVVYLARADLAARWAHVEGHRPINAATPMLSLGGCHVLGEHGGAPLPRAAAKGTQSITARAAIIAVTQRPKRKGQSAPIFFFLLSQNLKISKSKN